MSHELYFYAIYKIIGNRHYITSGFVVHKSRNKKESREMLYEIFRSFNVTGEMLHIYIYIYIYIYVYI